MIHILLSTIAGIGYILFLRHQDVWEKEPFGKMLLAVVVGGSASVLISFGLYEAWSLIGLSVPRNALGAFFLISPIEEFAKLSSFLLTYYFF